jgi:hypothetical protein
MLYVPQEGVPRPDGVHSLRVRMAKRVLAALLVAFIVVNIMFVAGHFMAQEFLAEPPIIIH